MRVREHMKTNASQCVIRHANPWPFIPPPLAAAPSEPFQNSDYPALISRSNLWRVDRKGMSSQLQNRCFLDAFQEFRDGLFPSVSFISSLLLRCDVLILECLFRPPLFAAAIIHHRFGEQLLAVAFQSIGVDTTDAHRPEPPATGLVSQVADLLVVPMNTHCLGSITSFRP